MLCIFFYRSDISVSALLKYSFHSSDTIKYRQKVITGFWTRARAARSVPVEERGEYGYGFLRNNSIFMNNLFYENTGRIGKNHYSIDGWAAPRSFGRSAHRWSDIIMFKVGQYSDRSEIEEKWIGQRLRKVTKNRGPELEPDESENDVAPPMKWCHFNWAGTLDHQYKNGRTYYKFAAKIMVRSNNEDTFECQRMNEFYKFVCVCMCLVQNCG